MTTVASPRSRHGREARMEGGGGTAVWTGDDRRRV